MNSISSTNPEERQNALIPLELVRSILEQLIPNGQVITLDAPNNIAEGMRLPRYLLLVNKDFFRESLHYFIESIDLEIGGYIRQIAICKHLAMHPLGRYLNLVSGTLLSRFPNLVTLQIYDFDFDFKISGSSARRQICYNQAVGILCHLLHKQGNLHDFAIYCGAEGQGISIVRQNTVYKPPKHEAMFTLASLVEHRESAWKNFFKSVKTENNQK